MLPRKKSENIGTERPAPMAYPLAVSLKSEGVEGVAKTQPGADFICADVELFELTRPVPAPEIMIGFVADGAEIRLFTMATRVAVGSMLTPTNSFPEITGAEPPYKVLLYT